MRGIKSGYRCYKNKNATKKNFEQQIKHIFAPSLQRFEEKLSPILQMATKIDEILEDKVDLVTDVKTIKEEEEEKAVIESRPIYPPKEPRITYNIDKQAFKIPDYHAPMITKDTKVIQSLCKNYFAFLNPGNSEIYSYYWKDGVPCLKYVQ